MTAGPVLGHEEERIAWSGSFPPLSDERVQRFLTDHAERMARFPGGDSWQIAWLAENLVAARAALARFAEIERAELPNAPHCYIVDGDTFDAVLEGARLAAYGDRSATN